MMDDLGLAYPIAHTIATAAEKTAVEADGFNWELYCVALRGPIKDALKRPEGYEAPGDLDIRPYQEERAKVLGKLESSEKKDSLPS